MFGNVLKTHEQYMFIYCLKLKVWFSSPQIKNLLAFKHEYLFVYKKFFCVSPKEYLRIGPKEYLCVSPNESLPVCPKEGLCVSPKKYLHISPNKDLCVIPKEYLGIRRETT